MGKRTKRRIVIDAIVQKYDFDANVMRVFSRMSILSKAFDKRKSKKRLRKFRILASSGKSMKFVTPQNRVTNAKVHHSGKE